MSQLRRLLERHPKGVTVAEISALLGVTTRSARRYLSELRSKHNAFDLEPAQEGGDKRWRGPDTTIISAYAIVAARHDRQGAPLR